MTEDKDNGYRKEFAFNRNYSPGMTDATISLTKDMNLKKMSLKNY